jgi:hypothetical protein
MDSRLRGNDAKKVADSLHCDLFYALVPREGFDKIRHRQADKKALKQILHLKQTMSLEDQSLSDKKLKYQFDQLVGYYINNPKKLWDEE